MTALVTLDTLSRWAAQAEQAGDAAAEADALMHHGNVAQARERIREAKEAARLLTGALVNAGAALPGKMAASTPVPLHLLNTPATRRLLALLRDAQEAAEEVDAERGHVLPAFIPLQEGESRGTGWAETISNLTERLRGEVEGPRGSEQESGRD